MWETLEITQKGEKKAKKKAEKKLLAQITRRTIVENSLPGHPDSLFMASSRVRGRGRG